MSPSELQEKCEAYAKEKLGYKVLPFTIEVEGGPWSSYVMIVEMYGIGLCRHAIPSDLGMSNWMLRDWLRRVILDLMPFLIRRQQVLQELIAKSWDVVTKEGWL